MRPFTLPWPIQDQVEAAAYAFLRPRGSLEVDFAEPGGEPALVAADSVSWRVFKNPAALFIGGVAAVVLELAEPRVRAGVWTHTSFRTAPVARLQRTALAAMVTVYAARSKAERMIAGVNRRHSAVTGVSDDGQPFAATDPDLLDWVQATASYGFGEAYDRFVHPLSASERDRFWAESAPAARLYGAVGAPTSQAQWRTHLRAMRPGLSGSPVIFEILDVMRRAAIAPAPARALQQLLIRAGVSLTPVEVAHDLGLAQHAELSWIEACTVRAVCRGADGLILRNAPPAQACLRMGLPADWLYG